VDGVRVMEALLIAAVQSVGREDVP